MFAQVNIENREDSWKASDFLRGQKKSITLLFPQLFFFASKIRIGSILLADLGEKEKGATFLNPFCPKLLLRLVIHRQHSFCPKYDLSSILLIRLVIHLQRSFCLRVGF
jgi:hypothetical protein